MGEYYYSLGAEDSEKQYEIILRARGGELEELTGVLTLAKTGETSEGKHYEANINVDDWGVCWGGEKDIIGLTLKGLSKIEVHKQPKRKRVVHEMSMSEAAKIIENTEYLKNMEMYIHYG